MLEAQKPINLTRWQSYDNCVAFLFWQLLLRVCRFACMYIVYCCPKRSICRQKRAFLCSGACFEHCTMESHVERQHFCWSSMICTSVYFTLVCQIPRWKRLFQVIHRPWRRRGNNILPKLSIWCSDPQNSVSLRASSSRKSDKFISSNPRSTFLSMLRRKKSVFCVSG